MTKRVSIRDFLASDSVALRASGDALFEYLSVLAKESKSIELDFSDIRFISRSFTHSMLEAIKDVSKVVSVDLSNTSSDVQQMIDLVRETKPLSYAERQRKHLMPADFELAQDKDFL